MKVELIKLDNVQQFYHKCKKGTKVDYIVEIFDTFEKATKTIIFVNTKKYADIVYDKLNNANCRCFIMFSDLTFEERDKCIKDFRDGRINVLIATNIISRGFDMRAIKLVINYDVPTQQQGKPDYENYLHRIGRSGRFGNTGVALTLFDREQDESAFFNIISHYKMDDKVRPLDGGAQQLKDIIEQAKEDEVL